MKRSFKYSFFSILVLFFINILFLSCDNPLFINVTKLYKVTFSTNGGTEIGSCRTDCIKTMPFTSRQDYSFLSWHLKSDFSDTPISFPLEITQDTTLYAKWQTQFLVSFECNGGAEITAYKTGIIESEPNTSRTNYLFAGWFLKSDFSGEPIEFPFIVTGPTILYAKWIKTYEVKFETNGGSEINAYRAAEIEISPETTRKGYSFIGWFSDSGFTKPINFPFALTADITLYAKWQQVFNVSFVTNGGTAVQSLTTGYIPTAPVTTKGDNDFAGWFLDADFSEGNKITFPYIVTDNITLYAKWQPVQCTITYKSNGSTGGTVPANAIVDKGSSYTVEGNTSNLEKTGYAFTKWNTKADGTGQGYSAGNTITVTSDIILYAQWGKDYAAMIIVPGGWFYLGDPAISNRPKITLSSFQIAQYELTYELWLEVYSWAKNNGYNITSASKGYSANDTYKNFVPATDISFNMACVWLNAYSEYKGYAPVYYRGSAVWRDDTNTENSFSWDRTKNGFRLPTECEWEFAAGGGDAEIHDTYTYSGSNTIDDVAWKYKSGDKECHSVGLKSANYLEIFDMSGNIAEFCFDEYADYGTGELTNPVHYSTSSYNTRVWRGGSIYGGASPDGGTYQCKIFYREVVEVAPAVNVRNYKTKYIGLRIARNAD